MSMSKNYCLHTVVPWSWGLRFDFLQKKILDLWQIHANSFLKISGLGKLHKLLLAIQTKTPKKAWKNKWLSPAPVRSTVRPGWCRRRRFRRPRRWASCRRTEPTSCWPWRWKPPPSRGRRDRRKPKHVRLPSCPVESNSLFSFEVYFLKGVSDLSTNARVTKSIKSNDKFDKCAHI